MDGSCMIYKKTNVGAHDAGCSGAFYLHGDLYDCTSESKDPKEYCECATNEDNKKYCKFVSKKTGHR